MTDQLLHLALVAVVAALVGYVTAWSLRSRTARLQGRAIGEQALRRKGEQR